MSKRTTKSFDFNDKINEYKEKYKEFLLDNTNDQPKISTCSINLNEILNGGFPSGKIIEIYGDEGSGKSSFALSLCAHVAKMYENKLTCIIDTEGGIFSAEILKNIGISSDRTIILNISKGKKVFEALGTFVASGCFVLIIIDSIAGMLTEDDIEGSSSIGSHARLVSSGLRIITGIANELKNTHPPVIVLINQVRNLIPSGPFAYGMNTTTTTGGKAIRYFSSMRISVRKGRAIHDKETIKGFYMVAKVEKSRSSTPQSICQIPLLFGKGISRIIEIINILLEKEIIEQSGSWFYFYNKERKYSFRSFYNIVTKCEEDKEFYNILASLI